MKFMKLLSRLSKIAAPSCSELAAPWWQVYSLTPLLQRGHIVSVRTRQCSRFRTFLAQGRKSSSCLTCGNTSRQSSSASNSVRTMSEAGAGRKRPIAEIGLTQSSAERCSLEDSSQSSHTHPRSSYEGIQVDVVTKHTRRDDVLAGGKASAFRCENVDVASLNLFANSENKRVLKVLVVGDGNLSYSRALTQILTIKSARPHSLAYKNTDESEKPCGPGGSGRVADQSGFLGTEENVRDGKVCVGYDEVFPRIELCVSTFEPRDKLVEKYPSALDMIADLESKGVRVLSNVDATKLRETFELVSGAECKQKRKDLSGSVEEEEPGLTAAGQTQRAQSKLQTSIASVGGKVQVEEGFDRIVFNFPHHPARRHIDKHRQLLRDFFASAREFLCFGGEVWVSLCRGQGGTGAENPDWNKSMDTVHFSHPLSSLLDIDAQFLARTNTQKVKGASTKERPSARRSREVRVREDVDAKQESSTERKHERPEGEQAKDRTLLTQSRPWRNTWQISLMAAHADLQLCAVLPFPLADLSAKGYCRVGYRDRERAFDSYTEGALLHVFKKDYLDTRAAFPLQWRRDVMVPVTEPFCDTAFFRRAVAASDEWAAKQLQRKFGAMIDHRQLARDRTEEPRRVSAPTQEEDTESSSEVMIAEGDLVELRMQRFDKYRHPEYSEQCSRGYHFDISSLVMPLTSEMATQVAMAIKDEGQRMYTEAQSQKQ